MTGRIDINAHGQPQPVEVSSYGSAVYIGPDCTHATVRKRIFAMEAAGVDVTGFTFRREKSNKDYVPEWNNVDLGVTLDRNYKKRVGALWRGLKILLSHRDTLSKAKYIYARNFDNILLGLAAKRLSGSRAKLVYEVPDVQEFFFGDSKRAKAFRWMERRILGRLNLLVASSPGFINGYFEPTQKYKGKSFVWENKLLADQMGELPSEAELSAMRPPPNPWVISWHGTLRCPETMKILSQVARRLGNKVFIYMRGKPVDYPELFEECFEGLSNVQFGGEYTLPGDLVDIYGPPHFAWCIDYFDPHGNSPLLLPNRLYQGGYFGVVPIGVTGQETGDFIARHNLGPQLKTPLVESVCDYFENLTWDEYLKYRQSVFAQRDALFIESAQDVRRMLEAIDAS